MGQSEEMHAVTLTKFP